MPTPQPVLRVSTPPPATDEQLARAAGPGDVAAFEALYERHHRRAAPPSARHMLGRPHDAEDVVQHTFVAADRAFRGGRVPNAVRAWLYTVARNRCVSPLRARREDAVPSDAAVPSTDDLAADVEHREDLRRLLADLRRLPDDQRAALLLAELGDLSHGEVAAVIGVRAGKVKALVFQARETLLARAHARAIPCQSIREELAVATGPGCAAATSATTSRSCPACSAVSGERVRAQRAALAGHPAGRADVALRDGVLGALAARRRRGAVRRRGAGSGFGVLGGEGPHRSRPSAGPPRAAARSPYTCAGRAAPPRGRPGRTRRAAAPRGARRAGGGPRRPPPAARGAARGRGRSGRATAAEPPPVREQPRRRAARSPAASPRISERARRRSPRPSRAAGRARAAPEPKAKARPRSSRSRGPRRTQGKGKRRGRQPEGGAQAEGKGQARARRSGRRSPSRRRRPGEVQPKPQAGEQARGEGQARGPAEAARDQAPAPGDAGRRRRPPARRKSAPRRRAEGRRRRHGRRTQADQDAASG